MRSVAALGCVRLYSVEEEPLEPLPAWRADDHTRRAFFRLKRPSVRLPEGGAGAREASRCRWGRGRARPSAEHGAMDEVRPSFRPSDTARSSTLDALAARKSVQPPCHRAPGRMRTGPRWEPGLREGRGSGSTGTSVRAA